MRKTLDARSVAALKPPKSGQVDYWDTKTPGFGIRVSVGGTKSWMLMYRDAMKSKKRLRLGEWPEMGLADARQAAKSYGGQVADGGNPAADKAAAKAEPTFGEFAAVYLERHARVNKKPRSVHEDILMLNADLLPHWRNHKLSDIHRKDVIALLDAIVARGAGVHANRVRALVSKMFSFAIARDLTEMNPAYKVPRPVTEVARDRVLAPDEIRRLWKALDGESSKAVAVFKLALLTAARRGELLGMEWSELDLDAAWWTIPAARSKNGLAHRVPLVPSAVALLRAIEADNHDSQYVFRGGRVGRPIANPQKWLLRLRQRARLQDFRLHDVRRTVASNLSALGVPRLVVSKVLNHVETGITAVYDRHSYDAEKRSALLKWERHLQQVLANRNNVVVLEAAR